MRFAMLQGLSSHHWGIAMRLTFCAVCGSSIGLEHHHFVPLALGGPDTDDNMLTLCTVHHGQIHNMRRAGEHAQLTRKGLAGVSWLGLGSPNPRAGGAATKALYAAKREALRPWLDADLSHADAAAAMNAANVLTLKGRRWTGDGVKIARRYLTARK